MARLRLKEGELRRLVGLLAEGDVIAFPGEAIPPRRVELEVMLNITEESGGMLTDTVDFLTRAGNAMAEDVNKNPRERMNIVPPSGLHRLMAAAHGRREPEAGDLVTVIAAENRADSTRGVGKGVVVRSYAMLFNAVPRRDENNQSEMERTREGQPRSDEELKKSMELNMWGRINTMMRNAGYRLADRNVWDIKVPGYYQFGFLEK